MPETKQQTAMMVLRERLQAKANDKDKYPHNSLIQAYATAHSDIIQLINTELLAVEKQQHIDTFNAGYREGEHDGINASSEEKDIAEFINATVYFNSTFNTK